MKRLVILAALSAAPMVACAGYVSTGQVEGSVCTGAIIESCEFVTVDAVMGDDDKLYTVKRRYSEVSDYSAAKGRCWVQINNRSGGLLGWATDAISGPDFYTRTSAGFEPVDVDYLTFPCIKR